MNEESKTPDSGEPQRPPSNASSNGANGAASPKPLSESDLIAKMVQASMVPIPAKFRELKELGENTELVMGVQNVFRGSALVTTEVCVAIKKDLSVKIRNTDDLELAAKLTTALAALIKAESDSNKVNSERHQSAGNERKGRRSFAKGEKIGPFLDAKAA